MVHVRINSSKCMLYNCGRIFLLYYHFSLVISYHLVWLGLELFGLVQVQVHTFFFIFTNPSARAGYDTRSILKQSLTGLNSEFSLS